MMTSKDARMQSTYIMGGLTLPHFQRLAEWAAPVAEVAPVG